MYSKLSVIIVCLLSVGCASLLPKNYADIKTEEAFLAGIVENNRPPLSPLTYKYPKTRVDGATVIVSTKYEFWRKDEDGVDPINGFSKFCSIKGGKPQQNQTKSRKLLFCDKKEGAFLIILYGSMEQTGSDIQQPFLIKHYISLVKNIDKSNVELLSLITEKYELAFNNIFVDEYILIHKKLNKSDLLSAIKSSVN